MLGIGVSLRHLRGTTAAVDAYKVAGFKPDLVFDFEQEYYRTSGTQTTFDNAITHSRSGNATMVDSDGLLKWAPHNLLTYSEQFDNAIWSKSSCTISANAIIAPDGTLTADEVIPDTTSLGVTQGYLLAGTYTANIWVKDAGRGACSVSMGTNTIGYLINIDLTDGSYISGRSYGGGVLVGYTIADAGLGWYRVSVTATANAGGVSVSGGDGVSSASGIYLWGAHLYRFDLGGMVNNPEQPAGFETYVPTTSAARYLARRGHHVYNGAEWVNEGALVEPTSAVQLLHTTDALVTQSHTVTAVPHTLHFTGTGTVTLSGAYSGSLVGTGTGEENRVSLTFTPTAASLTLTVSGTVSDAQLEVGSVPTSYIPNLAGSGTVTRAADTLTVPSANLPWPTPNLIGPELVTNGTFDTDINGWYPRGVVGGSSWDAGGYLATRDIGGADGGARTDVDVVAGRSYLLEGTIVSLGGQSILEYGDRGIGTNDSGTISFFSAGDFRRVITFSQAASSITFQTAATDTTTLWDNISLREIDPLAVSIQMEGRATGDTLTTTRWYLNASNYITQEINTSDFTFEQANAGTVDAVTGGSFTSGVNTAFNIASRHGSTFINGAVDGTALTVDTTPTALPDLSSSDLSLAYSGGPMILKKVRIFADDLGDSGIAEASA